MDQHTETTRIRVSAGASEQDVEITLGGNVASLRALLAGIFGEGARTAPITVNGQVATEDTPVPAGAEVELSRRDGAKA